jgi:hypothetical protein
MGAVAGVCGAVAMLVVLKGLDAVVGLQGRRVVEEIGSLVCFERCGQFPPAAAGLAAHGLLGAVCGALYAVCQLRTRPGGLVAVGLFYGFVLWVVGGLVIGPLAGPGLKHAIRSWPWLVASLVYGLGLGMAAIWAQIGRPPVSADAVPAD